MKYLFLAFSCLIIINCKTKQHAAVVPEQYEIIADCPEDGTCKFELLHNTSINMLYDDFGNLYMEPVDGNMILFKFEYKRNEIPNTMDGHYIEQIFMELDPNNLELQLENMQLQNVKLLFARFCYCKGQTGYYKVTQGNLEVKKMTNNDYQLNLTFNIDEVPQIISKISQVFNLK